VDWNDGGLKGSKGRHCPKKCAEGMVLHGLMVSVRRVVEGGHDENGALEFEGTITQRCTRTDCS